MIRRLSFLGLVVITSFLCSCISPQGRTVDDKRASIDAMHDETLHLLYQQKPFLENVIQKSSGYAVFSNVNAQFFIFGGGGGYGVAVDNMAAKRTYMKMAQLDLGFGLGVQDIRVVFVFHSEKALLNFIYSGWDFSAQGDAAAKARGKGVSATGELSIDSETSVYTMSEAGLMVKLNLAGTKYWRDNQMNTAE